MGNVTARHHSAGNTCVFGPPTSEALCSVWMTSPWMQWLGHQSLSHCDASKPNCSEPTPTTTSALCYCLEGAHINAGRSYISALGADGELRATPQCLPGDTCYFLLTLWKQTWSVAHPCSVHSWQSVFKGGLFAKHSFHPSRVAACWALGSLPGQPCCPVFLI